MITVCTVITVIGAFKLFTEIYVMTQGGPYNRTQVLGTFMYKSGFLLTMRWGMVLLLQS